VFKYRRLILVKKYLFISLLLSIIPLLVSVFLYDRYTASLLENILLERLESDVEATSEKMKSFLSARADRLNNLADIPEIEKIFLEGAGSALSEKLLDFIYLEVGSSDVYSANFLNANGNVIRSIPDDIQTVPSLTTIATFGNVSITAPVLPENGRPGWFGMKRDLFHDGHILGAIVLKVRLASLTENAASLYRKDFYEPVIQMGGNYLSVLGMKTTQGEPLSKSREIIPGWNVFLSKNAKNTERPRVRIRYLLLIIVAVACAAIILVFIHMSERLENLIIPLTEGAKAIAKGDFSVRVSEQSPGELRDLAHSFNQMSVQLAAMIDSRVDVERRGALGNLAAGIAHEIRNPLTTLRTSIHALKYTEKDNEKREMFDLIAEEIIRIDAMVEEFLSYARPHDPSIEDLPVKDFLHSIEALTLATLSDAKIKLVYLGDQSIVLRADSAQLRQVFMNLILNGIDAMPEGGRLSIRVENVASVVAKASLNVGTTKQAMITISDNGVGMSEDLLDKVQVPFFTTKQEGTGLGLSICAQLLRKNSGTLTLESGEGVGTSVILCLPSKERVDGNE
jgi:two-component system sensor histidine kinase AtoS